MRAVIQGRNQHFLVSDFASIRRIAFSLVKKDSNGSIKRAFSDIHITKTIAPDSSTTSKLSSTRFNQVPTLKEFMQTQSVTKNTTTLPPTTTSTVPFPAPQPLKFYIETYGCQMNVSDSEIVRSVLSGAGYHPCSTVEEADILLTNTCAIRENAEVKVKHRLQYFQSLRKKNRLSKNQLKKEAEAERQLLQQQQQPEIERIQQPTAPATAQTATLIYEENQLPMIGSSVESTFSPADALKRQLSKQSIYPLVGVLGCMAERMKEKLLLEDSVDFICGPDAYRDIPRLLHNMISLGEKQSNTSLSFHETYADITPTRDRQSVSSFLSIMRGCNNMCSFCIVPFTRGRERSRPLLSILQEVKDLVNQGVKEVIVLGQNVNGYHDYSEETLSFLAANPSYVKLPGDTHDGDSSSITHLQQYKASPGFTNLYNSKKKDLPGVRFAHLLSIIAQLHPEVRIRFTSPHPKDFPEEVLDVIASYYNICSSIHLPIQSGSSSVLDRMRRGYTREAYLQLVQIIRTKIPSVTLSTDIITGFCAETKEEHEDTISIMKEIQYDQAFMFAYSKREKTHAYYHYEDNIQEDLKIARLNEVIETFRNYMIAKNVKEEYGQYRLVLVEGDSIKSTKEYPTLTGRTDGNKRVIFPATELPIIAYSDVIQLWKEQKCNRAEGRESLGVNDPLPIPELLFGEVNKWTEELKKDLLVKGYSSSEQTGGFARIGKDRLVGEYVLVKILKANSPTLRGVAVARTTLTEMKQFDDYLRGEAS